MKDIIINKVVNNLGMNEEYCEWYKCPRCEHSMVMENDHFCSNCGSKFEWTGINELVKENGEFKNTLVSMLTLLGHSFYSDEELEKFCKEYIIYERGVIYCTQTDPKTKLFTNYFKHK